MVQQPAQPRLPVNVPISSGIGDGSYGRIGMSWQGFPVIFKNSFALFALSYSQFAIGRLREIDAILELIWLLRMRSASSCGQQA